MTLRRIPILLIAFALVAGLLAGCGGDSKEEYANDVSEVLDPLGAELQTLGTEASSATSPDQLVPPLTDAEDSLTAAVDDLEAIDPPEDVADIHEDLITSIEELLAPLTSTREAAEAGDSQAAQAEAQAFFQASLDFQTEIQDITQRAEDAGVPVDAPE